MRFTTQTPVIDKIHRWIDFFAHLHVSDDTVGLAHEIAAGSVNPNISQRPDLTALACLFIASNLHGSPIFTQYDERCMRWFKLQRDIFWNRKKKYDLLHDPESTNFFRLNERADKIWKFEDS